MMIENDGRVRAEAFADDLAAELTTVAYFVALRHCTTAKWLDLQLELWQALSAALAKGGIAFSARREVAETPLGAEDFLAELAYVAYRIALSYGCRKSFLDLELELHHTLRSRAARIEQKQSPARMAWSPIPKNGHG